MPARRLRSCLPPVRIAVTRAPRLIQSAPAPFGPLNLCADSDSRSTPSALTSTGILPTDWTASVWKRAPRAWASRASSAIGWIGPDLVVRVHHRHERGVVGERRRQRRRVDDAGGADGSSVVRQPRRASALRVVSTASCSMLLAIEVPAAGRLERLGDAAQCKVVGLGAAAREHDLGRFAADERGDRRARLVEHAPWRADRSGARSRRCRNPRQDASHRLDDRRVDRCRRVMVEIDAHRRSSIIASR